MTPSDQATLTVTANDTGSMRAAIPASMANIFTLASISIAAVIPTP
jgi:tRNA threonylcarbamoyladenosine modification (KEOPS) complex  Pcc1 subunit